MKKKKFRFSDFSKKELEHLKEFYIDEKIKSMSESELRRFVYENISHQIKNTIGDEEEQEAWEEIEKFFKDNFEIILKDIKNKFEATNEDWTFESKKDASTLLNSDSNEPKNEKIDMWKD